MAIFTIHKDAAICADVVCHFLALDASNEAIGHGKRWYSQVFGIEKLVDVALLFHVDESVVLQKCYAAEPQLDWRIRERGHFHATQKVGTSSPHRLI